MWFTRVCRVSSIVSRRAAMPIAAALTTFLAAGCAPDPAKAPTAFTSYEAPDKSFVCQAPDGWKKSESAAAGIMSGVTMTSGTAKVSIASDLGGSLSADMTRASNAQMDNTTGLLPPEMQAQMPKPVPPVEKQHKGNKRIVSSKYKDYQENAMQTLTAPIGEARISEFNAEAGMFAGGKVRGYRVTALSGDREVTAYCVCPESDWPTLKPAFEKILTSIGPGSG